MTEMAGEANGNLALEPEVSADEEEPDDLPMVIQCCSCCTILGDSTAWICANQAMKTITLARVCYTVGLNTDLETSGEEHDLGSTYCELTCKKCDQVVGKMYKTTPQHLDTIREVFTFYVDSIISYQVGSAEQHPGLTEALLSLPSLQELKMQMKQTQTVLLNLNLRLHSLEERFVQEAEDDKGNNKNSKEQPELHAQTTRPGQGVNSKARSSEPEQPTTGNFKPQSSELERSTSRHSKPRSSEPEQPTSRNSKPRSSEPEQPTSRNSKPRSSEPEQPISRNSKPWSSEPEQRTTRNFKPQNGEPEQPTSRNSKPRSGEPEQPISRNSKRRSGEPERPTSRSLTKSNPVKSGVNTSIQDKRTKQFTQGSSLQMNTTYDDFSEGESSNEESRIVNEETWKLRKKRKLLK